ncbi:cell division protein FtsB [Anoxybacillus calidus]|jgi:hypothetical protein|uniref:Cell division protein FtsB n=1 Tax=[Anoxybacillus] calidus TaxID=575178 RepID=A0A7V9Z1C7_9BACL|nr:DUF3899 domain-containing protein [Anoxybacillus calidus]MBA2872115.1 cell division protein FtsB [Anoxybacillus calidus]
MKHISIRTVQISLTTLLLALILTIIQGDVSLLTFINISFLLSLPLLMLGGFLFVYEGGFFNGLIYSYRRLRRSTKMGKYVAQFDHLDHESVVPMTFSVTKPIFFSGLLIFLFTLIIAYFMR